MEVPYKTFLWLPSKEDYRKKRINMKKAVTIIFALIFSISLALSQNVHQLRQQEAAQQRQREILIQQERQREEERQRQQQMLIQEERQLEEERQRQEYERDAEIRRQQAQREEELAQRERERVQMEMEREQREREQIFLRTDLGQLQNNIRNEFNNWAQRGEFETTTDYEERLERQSVPIFYGISFDAVYQLTIGREPSRWRHLKFGTYNPDNEYFQVIFTLMDNTQITGRLYVSIEYAPQVTPILRDRPTTARWRTTSLSDWTFINNYLAPRRMSVTIGDFKDIEASFNLQGMQNVEISFRDLAIDNRHAITAVFNDWLFNEWQENQQEFYEWNSNQFFTALFSGRFGEMVEEWERGQPAREEARRQERLRIEQQRIERERQAEQRRIEQARQAEERRLREEAELRDRRRQARRTNWHEFGIYARGGNMQVGSIGQRWYMAFGLTAYQFHNRFFNVGVLDGGVKMLFDNRLDNTIQSPVYFVNWANVGVGFPIRTALGTRGNQFFRQRSLKVSANAVFNSTLYSYYRQVWSHSPWGGGWIYEHTSVNNHRIIYEARLDWFGRGWGIHGRINHELFFSVGVSLNFVGFNR